MSPFGRAGGRDAPTAPPWVEVSATDPRLPDELRGQRDALRLRVEGLSCLLDLVSTSTGLVEVESLTLEVSPWRPPGRDALTRPGQVPHLLDHAVRRRSGRIVVSLRVGEPVDLSALLAAAVPAVSLPARARGGLGRPDLGLLATSADTAPFVSVADRLLAVADLDDEQVRPTDVLVIGAHAADPPADVAAVTVRVDPGTPACVDPAVHRPVGRVDFGGAVLTGRVGLDGVELVTPDGTVLRAGGKHGLTDLGVSAVLPFAGVRFDQPVRGAADLRWLRQLSGCGLVVSSPTEHVHDRLARLWADPVPSEPADREVASVRQRRAAHRDFSTVGVGTSTGSGSAQGAPTVSVLLSSNRPEALPGAIERLSRLEYPRIQVVLGLHGVPVPAALAHWCERLRVRGEVLVRELAGAEPFGAVLADLTAHADGELITKVDDDDMYGPHHLWDLVTAWRYSGAAVVGKGAEFVHLVDADTTVRRNVADPEKYGRTVAGGTMLVAQSDLAAVGGWRPVEKSVDRGLLDRVLRAGAGVYRTHGLGYVYVRGTGAHTWAVDDGYFTSDIRLRAPGLFMPDDDPERG